MNTSKYNLSTKYDAQKYLTKQKFSLSNKINEKVGSCHTADIT